jgi:Fe2+ transport system protein FeoA
MGLFSRRKPLHERLADAGGITDALSEPEAPSLAAEAPGWDGERRGEPGIHGVPRARRWDTVATADAPALKGDSVHFVALADGTLVVDEDEPDGALASLADAVEQSVPPPYRAEAVRKGPETWAVAASRIAIASIPGLSGDQAELTSTREGRVLRIDGRTTMGSARELERLGEIEGTEYVVLAKRLDGDLWEVEATAL